MKYYFIIITLWKHMPQMSLILNFNNMQYIMPNKTVISILQ